METQNIVEELKKSGIRAEAYKRPPMGKHVFALTILPKHKEGVVTVNQGRAKAEVYGNKKLRQAVVTVREPGREVSRFLSSLIEQDRKPTRNEILMALKTRFPIIMPRNTGWTISRESAVLREGNIRRWSIAGSVRARVIKTTTNHFLIGMDESRNFVSPLPKKVTSVSEAHKALKPKYKIRKGSVRQGEWFFVPCTKAQKEILEKIATSTSNRIRSYTLGRTTHTAKSSIRIRGGRGAMLTYARGYVTDKRTGHHKSLFLKDWHKVIKNKETFIKVDPAQREMALRQQSTWD